MDVDRWITSALEQPIGTVAVFSIAAVGLLVVERWRRREQHSGRKSMTLAHYAVAGVCTAGSVGLVLWAASQTQRQANWKDADGHVVAVECFESQPRFGSLCRSRIEFSDVDGRAYEFASTVGSVDTRVGDRVAVQYPVKDPDRARTVADTEKSVVSPFVLAGISIALAVLALAGLSHAATDAER